MTDLNRNFYEEVKRVVHGELTCSAHDLSHVYRVYANACHLATIERIDMDTVKTAALLHDIARVREDKDTTGFIDHAKLGAEMARDILLSFGCEKSFVEAVADSIRTHRYKGGSIPQTPEAKILFDADKLDIIGAIGLARSYMIAGEYGQPIYSDQNIEDYVKENLFNGSPRGKIINVRKHAPNLEYEIKVKNIPDRLFTLEAKKIARKRIAFMEAFFERLKKETKIDSGYYEGANKKGTD